MAAHKILLEFLLWVAKTGAYTAIGFLLIGPFASLFASRKRFHDIEKHRKAAHDFLFSEWRQLGASIALSHLHLKAAFEMLNVVYSINKNRYQDATKLMADNKLSLATALYLRDDLAKAFSNYTKHLTKAEHDYRQCISMGKHLLDNTIFITEIGVTDDFETIIVIRQCLATTIEISEHMLNVIKDAKLGKSSLEFFIFEYLTLQNNMKLLINSLVSDPYRAYTMVRIIDFLVKIRHFSSLNMINMSIDNLSPHNLIDDNKSQEEIDVAFEKYAEYIIPKDEQRNIGQHFINHPPYVKWIDDANKWVDELEIRHNNK